MKKIIKRAFIVIAILLFITAFCFDNIKRNSVYYAKHTPHKEGTEPVLMMVVDNLFWIDTPEIGGIEYSFDGGNSVVNKNYNGESQSVFTGGQEGKYYDFFDNKRTYYEFNRKFNLTYSVDKNLNEKNLDATELLNLKKEIYYSVQPVIDAQRKPKVNLQWLFDIVYKDKFN